jgi:hypothetical protein
MHRVTLCTVPFLLLACGDIDDGSVCDAASRHVAACTGRATPTGTAACGEKNADLAHKLLGLGCDGIKALAANTYGKADTDGCLAPWDCPEDYPSTDQPCGLSDMIKCQSYCETFFTDPYMRLSKVICEVLAGKMAHCECKGYWLPWKKKDADPQPADPPPDDPPPDDDPGDWWP